MRAHEFGRRRLRRPAPHTLGGLPLTGRTPLVVLAAALAAASRSTWLSWIGFLLSGLGPFSRPSRRDGFDVGKFSKGIARGFGDDLIYAGVDTQRAPPSIANLPRDLTINGQTVQPTVMVDLKHASAPFAAEFGGTFSEAGSGASPSYSQGCPLMGADAAVLYNGAKYHQSGTAITSTTHDRVIGMIFRSETTGANVYFATKGTATSTGINVYQVGGGSLRVGICDGATLRTVTVGTLVDNAWYMFEIYIDFDGNAQGYLNGVATGTPTAVSLTGIANGYAPAIGANGDGTTPCTSAISAVWHYQAASGWLDGQTTAAIRAAERFRAVMGIRPQLNTASGGVNAAPLNWARATLATLQKYNPATDADEMYSVGSGWPRTERWRMSDGTTVMGFRSELQRTNLITYSHVSEATWTKADAGDTTAAADGPWGAGSAEGWVADSTNGSHARYLACTTTAAVHAAFVRVKAGAVTWVAIHDPISNVGRYFNLSTGALGGVYGGAPTASYTVDNRNGWWTCAMVWTATAAARNFTVYPAEADGDAAFAGNGSSASIYFAHAQVELGDCCSSAIRTSGTTAQRNKDELEYTISSITDGALCYDAVHGVTYTAGAMGATAFYHAAVSDGGVTNRGLVYSTGGNPTAIANADGVVTGTTWTALQVVRYGLAWRANRLEQWRDGAMVGTPDVAVTQNAAMTQLAIAQAYNSSNEPSIPVLIRNVRVYRRFPGNMGSLTARAA